MLAWGRLPVPKELTTVATAKNTASHFMLSRRSMTYMGPPTMWPSSSVMRYLWDRVTSTNLVVMPKKAVIHIQKSAAGPPRKTASATPPMLPVPTVPDMAVVSAWKWVASPGSSALSYLPLAMRMAWRKYLICGNFK